VSLTNKALEPVTHRPNQLVLPDIIAKPSDVSLKGDGLGPIEDHLVAPERQCGRFVGCGQEVVPGFQALLVPFDVVQAHLDLVERNFY
jgi:hypothetical protein